MSLRVIGGSLRNRPLKTPKGPQTRPSLAILRKAVFDICQQEVVDAHFLDLFAGSGAMGIEAISRGAAHATFIDKDRHALRCIQENLEALGIRDKGDVFPDDALSALKKLSKKPRRFDIVYVDPPYALDASRLLEVLNFLDGEGDLGGGKDRGNLLSAGAVVFVEESAPSQLEPDGLNLHNLRHINTRQFSQSLLHQFRL